jgi:hypothetical protein
VKKGLGKQSPTFKTDWNWCPIPGVFVNANQLNIVLTVWNLHHIVLKKARSGFAVCYNSQDVYDGGMGARGGRTSWLWIQGDMSCLVRNFFTLVNDIKLFQLL